MTMAPGGNSRRQSDDEQDGIHEQRPSYQRANSVDEVSGQAPAIVSTFLSECFRADGLPVPQELSENQRKVNKEVAHVIRDIGDRLSNDTTLNSLISQVVVSKDTAFDTFLQVGAQIFSDGKVNWGRIVTLFYFGYKLALQVIKQIPLIKMIIGWVCEFIKDRLAKWIFEQGGWESVVDYFKALRQRHDLEVYFVFSCICALGFYLLYRK
ncbi:apoptosis regulator BAX-like [Stylophora pistillata]|nr:apoptosis regulator BAX-like [Stylophora pistillata]